jgi:hypothetical protein
LSEPAGRRNQTRAIPGAKAATCGSAAASTGCGVRLANATKHSPSNTGVTKRYLRIVTF